MTTRHTHATPAAAPRLTRAAALLLALVLSAPFALLALLEWLV